MNTEQSKKYYQLMANDMTFKHRCELEQKKQEWDEKRELKAWRKMMEDKLDEVLKILAERNETK